MPSQRPLLVIEAHSQTWGARFREFFAARYMFWGMVRSAALLPYTELVFGFLWTMLRPLVFLAVIVFIKRSSGAAMGEPIEYELFVLSGLVLWWYFVDAVRQSSRAIFKYRALISKIYFPRLVTPAIPVVARTFDLGVQAVPVIGFLIYFGHAPGVGLALLPFALANVMVLALSLGYIFSIMSTVVRDVDRVLDNILYVGFLLSPVIYATTLVPEQYRTLYAFLNPMVGPLSAFRAALFSGYPLTLEPFLISWAVSLALLALGVLAFTRIEEDLAERVL